MTSPDEYPGLTIPAWMEVWRGMLFAQRSMLSELDKVQKRDFALTIPQFEALLTLWEAPGHRLRMSELSASLLYSSGSATKLLDRLVERNVVVRVSEPGDSRVVVIALTGPGEELIVAARAAHGEFLQQRFAALIDDDELAVMLRVTQRLADDRGVRSTPSSGFSR
ncbi:MarR family winged helix-turn-helix transcriptional regulator [Arthrobacter psychrolactophilus]